jgi:hypothetical protein
MPLELGGQIEQRGVELVHVIRGHQACDERRGARPEARGDRYLRPDPEGDAVGGMERLEPAHAEVRPVERHARRIALDGELARLLHLELEMHGERRGERVETRPEVRRRRRHPHEPPPLH